MSALSDPRSAPLGVRALRQLGPVDTLDTALAVVRHAPIAQLTGAFGAGLPLACVLVAVYYLERVEGVQSLRPLLAAALVIAYLWRALWLGRIARSFALVLRPALPMPEDAGRALDVVSTASVLGLGLWVWLWPLAGLAKISPFAVLALLPVLAVRGAIAPSWLARAACGRERGFAALGLALDDSAGVRSVMLLVEAMLLLGGLLLLLNLYALLAFGLMLASSLLGLDVAFVSAFLSFDNDVVLLALLAGTFVLLEPLRAAVSAQAFADARGRKDGADLHAAVDALLGATPQEPGKGPGRATRYGVALGCLLAAAGAQLPAVAHADGPAAATQDGAAAHGGATLESQRDEAVQADVEAILRRREFSEFAKSDARSFWKWLQTYLDKLLERAPKDDDKDRGGDWHLSLPAISPWHVMFAALLLLMLVVLYVSTDVRRARKRAAPGAELAVRAHPTEQAPHVLLDEAALLAEQGRLREALRSLYIATLAALDRARVIRFEPAKTNGQYLRAMPRGELRQTFGAFTRTFDHKWYGHEATSRGDYERCRELADRICQVEPPA